MLADKQTFDDITSLTDEELIHLIKAAGQAEHELMLRLASRPQMESPSPEEPQEVDFPFVHASVNDTVINTVGGALPEVDQANQDKEQYKENAIKALEFCDKLEEDGWTRILEQVDETAQPMVEFTANGGQVITLNLIDHYFGNKEMPPFVIFQLPEIAGSVSFFHSGHRNNDGEIVWDDLNKLSVDMN